MILTLYINFDGIQAYRRKSLLKYIISLFDVDLDLMTLILKPDLAMVKMYLYTENELLTICGSKVTAQTDRPE